MRKPNGGRGAGMSSSGVQLPDQPPPLFFRVLYEGAEMIARLACKRVVCSFLLAERSTQSQIRIFSTANAALAHSSFRFRRRTLSTSMIEKRIDVRLCMMETEGRCGTQRGTHARLTRQPTRERAHKYTRAVRWNVAAERNGGRALELVRPARFPGPCCPGALYRAGDRERDR